MKFIILLFTILLSLNAQNNSQKVVFDLSSGDIEVFKKKVLSGIAFHKTHYADKLEELEVSVVIHGDSYKFFLKDLSKSKYKNDVELKKGHKSIVKRIEILSSMYNIEFLMCGAGMEKLKINKSNIYDYIKIIPTSTVGLIDKQQDGYAYIPIF